MKFRSILRLVGVLVLVAALWAGTATVSLTGFGASPRSWRVPGDCSTIQQCINKASPGDTIRVGAGVYEENLTITKGLTLQGAGRDQTILIGTVSITTADEVAFKGFTLTGGRGLTIRDSSGITISDNTISESRGAGLLLSNAAATIEANLIAGNTAQGVLISFNSDVTLRANTIMDNGKDGVEVDSSYVVLDANIIKGNGGCGVKADSDSTVDGEDNAIVRNGQKLCAVSSAILERVPPPAPINLSISPEGWTNQATVGWENPNDPSEIVAFWYKIGSQPTGPEDGRRLGINKKPLVIKDSPEGEQPIYVWLEDGLGNKSHQNRAQGSFLFDKTPPPIHYTVNPEPNEHGWWNSTEVTVTFECGEDQLSGLASCTPSAPVVVSEEGRHQVVGVAVDNAGNRAEVIVKVNIDRTAPTIQVGSPQGEEGQEGWYASDVTVPYTAQDNLSGFANGKLTIEGSERTSGEGPDRKVVIQVSDLADNETEVTAGPYKIDKTPPVINALEINGGADLACSLTVTLDLEAEDPGDGSGLTEMRFSNDGQTWSQWETFKDVREGWDLSAFGGSTEGGHRIVWAQVKDEAGNACEPFIARIGLFYWSQTFGGSDNDWGRSVQQTTDGGYILLGNTWSYGAGDDDFWLIKTDASGNKEWDRTFGGSSSDFGTSVQQTTDGGYILLGNTWSYGAGDDDFWLIKTDASGNKEWDRTFGGSNYDAGRSVQQTSDGGYILLGKTRSYGAGWDDFWLIKTDASGNKAWDRTFGGSNFDWGRSVQQTTDGGYILLGNTRSWAPWAISNKPWLIKTDINGNKQWDTIPGVRDDYGYSVQQTSDGGYILLGRFSAAGWRDFRLIKTDAYGNKQWDKTFGGSDNDWGRSVQQTTDGGYILLGNTRSYGAGWDDFWLIKTDASGNKEWDRTFGGSSFDWGRSVQQTSDGGFILLGGTKSYGAGGADFWLIKYKYCPEE